MSYALANLISPYRRKVITLAIIIIMAPFLALGVTSLLTGVYSVLFSLFCLATPLALFRFFWFMNLISELEMTGIENRIFGPQDEMRRRIEQALSQEQETLKMGVISIQMQGLDNGHSAKANSRSSKTTTGLRALQKECLSEKNLHSSQRIFGYIKIEGMIRDANSMPRFRDDLAKHSRADKRLSQSESKLFSDYVLHRNLLKVKALGIWLASIAFALPYAFKSQSLNFLWNVRQVAPMQPLEWVSMALSMVCVAGLYLGVTVPKARELARRFIEDEARGLSQRGVLRSTEVDRK
ncbi:MAG: hypothetical protein V4655_00640 [Bdellovibrionota bacterium]|nr:MAG: hypothetical protein EOP10_03240 [Pseudomonadota bacterium]